ncbi:MAG: carboxypeptidase regulatory-like domain-containing protein, partial [Planctomycetota bacterium]
SLLVCAVVIVGAMATEVFRPGDDEFSRIEEGSPEQKRAKIPPPPASRKGEGKGRENGRIRAPVEAEPPPAPNPEAGPPGEAPGPDPEGILVSGRVTDKATGKGIGGASIAFGTARNSPDTVEQTKTGPGGRYRFILSDFDGERIFVYAMHPEYDAWKNYGSEKVSARPVVHITLAKGGRISGKVLDLATQLPLPDARVRVVPGGTVANRSSSSTDKRSLETKTGGGGEYEIRGIRFGDVFTATAVLDGYVEEAKGFLLSAGSPGARIDFFLTRGQFLRGAVTDGEGKPVVAAKVYCFPTAWDSTLLNNPKMVSSATWEKEPIKSRRAIADEEGVFAFDGLRESVEYTVLVRHPGFPDGIHRGKPGRFAGIILQKESTLSIALKNGAGEDIIAEIEEFSFALKNRKGLSLTRRYPERGVAEHGAKQAALRVHGLAKGEYTIWFNANGYLSAKVDRVSVDERSEASVEIVLRRGGFYMGSVVDGDSGAVIEGASVRVRSEEGTSTSTTDGEGRFRVTGLGGKIRSVTVRSRGYAQGAYFREKIPGFHDPRVKFELNSVGNRFLLRKCGILEGTIVVPPGGTPPKRYGLFLVQNVGRGGTGGNRFPEGGVFQREIAPQVLSAAAVYTEGYAPAIVQNIEIRPGRRTPVKFLLEAGSTVRGIVLDRRSGESLFAVSVKSTDILGRGETTGTNRRGEFTLHRLPACPLTLTISKAGYEKVERKIEFKRSGEVESLEVRLKRDGD